uniref:Putative secreted protein n=1 Tax=Amblyomma parvum TaxID=251391 RepID=A0A023G046_AMBPA
MQKQSVQYVVFVLFSFHAAISHQIGARMTRLLSRTSTWFVQQACTCAIIHWPEELQGHPTSFCLQYVALSCREIELLPRAKNSVGLNVLTVSPVLRTLSASFVGWRSKHHSASQ